MRRCIRSATSADSYADDSDKENVEMESRDENSMDFDSFSTKKVQK